MRLADFIMSNIEAIVKEWEAFARSIWPGLEANPLILRDHVEDMLRALARDMQTSQTAVEQIKKSEGRSAGGKASDRLDTASCLHAIGRANSGFHLNELIAEYRALRASVVQLWEQSHPRHDTDQLDDLTRFHEGIDQLLTESVLSFTERIESSREIFLGILSHDLRTPLHAVTMLAHLMVESGKLDPVSHEMALQIVDSATNMKGLVRDLLDFSTTRLGGKMEISPAAMDLGPLCREVLDEMEAVYPQQSFVLECDGDLCGGWDAARLRQAISNLLRNAAQHGCDTAPIVLSARGEGAEVVLEVHNQGSPIPAECLRLIFDPMMRVPRNEASALSGSVGLGLFIAREVATAHGGEIDVRSDPEETVFIIRLPRAAGV